MPDTPGLEFRTTSLSETDRAVQESPALSDLSERDKPWDKHKANADWVSKHYAGSEFDRYSQRTSLCADLLRFKLAPDAFEGTYKLKLASAKFCRVRHCPICQWRRSLRWKARACDILPKVVDEYPKARWLFLTLTVKNCDMTDLRSTLNRMNKAFKRMTERKAWPAIGWIRSVEVTRNRHNGTAHPHFHCLLMVKPSYFGREYLSQAAWVDLWQSCGRLDYKPILDVQAMRKGVPPTVLIPEILKYAVKESDMVGDREWFLELTHQLHKTLGVTVGGVLRGYFRNVEREVEENLVGEDAKGEVDEGSLFFGWRSCEKRYRLR